MGLGRVNTEPTALAAGTAGLHPLKSPDPWESPFLETPPFSPSPRPPKRRRRTAPALGPSAVYALYRRNRNETKQDRPLLVGRSCVTNAPKALVAGTAGPQAAGPCSWACRRVCALPPEQKRNEAPKPPARGAWVREYGAEGTGRRHCRLVGTADPVELGADGGDGDLDEYCQE